MSDLQRAFAQSSRVENEIVVTGLGVLSPFGHDLTTHVDALLQGKSAVRLLEPISGVDGRYFIGSQISGFDPKAHVQPRKSIKVMCYEIQLAFASALQACKSAGIAAGTVDPDRVGTVFAAELLQSDIADIEEIVRLCAENGVMDPTAWGRKAMESMYPLWMLRSLPNMAACHVGIAIDARGPNNTITTEGTSSLNAILEAINVIRRDQADVMVVGTTSTRVCPSRHVQRWDCDFSNAHFDHERACKPFDAKRDGTVGGECSASVVLERRAHAERRGASIYGTIECWASCFSPSTSRRWSGVQPATANVLRLLTARSGLESSRFDHINACANGTIGSDSFESHGIHDCMPSVPVVSMKGAIGDPICASGLIEWLSSLDAMKRGTIPATANLSSIADDCPVQVIHGGPKPRTTDRFIKLSHTPTGRCVGIVTRVD